MTNWITISSGDEIPTTERNFRVMAGPGAGKTYWLAKHVRRVIRSSKRLAPVSRVACISYTNTAVAELMETLGDCADRAEGTTIHSFLYQNLVRPYAHLLKSESGEYIINHERIRGHDVHRPSRTHVEAWLENTLPNKGAAKQCLCGSPWPQIYSYLAAVQWRPDPNWIWQPVKPKAAPPKYLPTKSLGTYKSHYWADGVIDHDDVLRFAYMLLSEHRELASFLSCRFPYIFVDEFQDTNPVQTEVLRWLAEAGSTIGVIGDPVQSIFLFQGAQPNGFEDFLLAEQDHFQIQNNRRSTDEIVAFINELRKDGLVQEGIRNESGPGALLLIGDQQKAVARAKELCGDNVALVVLARKNDVVAAVRNLGSQVCLVSWNEFQQKDFDRFVFANRLLPCVELARNGHFALAIDGATRAISRRNGTLRKPIECHSGVSEIIARGLAVTIIERALTFPDSMNFSDAYNSLGYAIADNLPGAKLPKIMRGKAEIIAKGIAFNDLVRSMSAVDNVRDARTIHVAKGAQFGAVMVIIEDLDTLARCCDKTFGNGEEERLLYVAFSRARDMLFMQSDEKPPNGLLARLRDMSVSIEHV